MASNEFPSCAWDGCRGCDKCRTPVACNCSSEIGLLKRKIAAQQQLLICYRLGKRPSEKLFRELEKLEGVG